MLHAPLVVNNSVAGSIIWILDPPDYRELE